MKTRKTALLVCLLVAVSFLPLTLLARDISPLVSTDWLEKNLTNPKVKVVDIRKVEEYKEGHIPGAMNAFYGVWAIKKNDLQNEIPANDDLADLIASLGISGDSQVVVVGKADSTPELVNATRVAWTLLYAGVQNVAVLDGGQNKWVADKKALSKDMVKAADSGYKPKWNQAIFASKDQVMKRGGQTVLVDVRMPEFFFGVAKLDFVKRPGHIQGAVSLPVAWIFAKEGTWKSKEDLEAMVFGVVGKDKSKEVMVYCDTGRLCSGMWFLISEVLGYGNVKSYDGSMEEWTRDPQAPVVKYSWQ